VSHTRRPADVAQTPSVTLVTSAPDHSIEWRSDLPLAEKLGFSPILVGRIDEGGQLLHIPGPLMLHNLVEHPLK
jgi:hypothetical protein